MSHASLTRSRAPRPPTSARAACLGRRGHALALHRQGNADLQPLDRRRLGQGIGGVGDARCAMHLRAWQLQGRRDRRTRGDAGLSAGAWQMQPLSRGYVEAKSNRPGDAPAINPRLLPLDWPICRIGRYLAPNAAQVRTICQYDGDQRSAISSSHKITVEFGVIFKPKLCN